MPAKKINFKLIDEEESPQLFALLQKLRDEFHPDIHLAKIALAWQLNVKPDADGHELLGKCIRASDLQRELVDYDFCILLNKDFWTNELVTDAQRRALMDHELMHAQRATTADGEDQFDERGRPVWRIRGHDIEEFAAIVRRHGCWKRDLQRFADELVQRRANPLFDEAVEHAGDNMQALADRDGVSMTITCEGETLAEFKPKGRLQ